MINKTKKEFNDGITIYYANELARMRSKFTLVLHLIFSQIKPYEKNDTFVNYLN